MAEELTEAARPVFLLGEDFPPVWWQFHKTLFRLGKGLFLRLDGSGWVCYCDWIEYHGFQTNRARFYTAGRLELEIRLLSDGFELWAAASGEAIELITDPQEAADHLVALMRAADELASAKS